ncbi:MAG: rRNA maturation RNase YbeY [Rhizobiaceae bacterium]
MASPQIDISRSGIDDNVANQITPLIEPAIRQAIADAGLQFEKNAELSILLADDDKLQELNHRWRGIEKPTNVLSFPGEELSPGQPGGSFLGDIVVSLETAVQEAKVENKEFNDHFTHLIIHGFLHLFGYDHETDEQAHQMESLEKEILGNLGISDPYESGQAQ